MSQRFERRTVTVEREFLVEEKCDGCGVLGEDTDGLIVVSIEVNIGEEFGRRDDFDYCNDCLVERADALVAAGSRCELVTGEPVGDEEAADV